MDAPLFSILSWKDAPLFPSPGRAPRPAAERAPWRHAPLRPIAGIVIEPRGILYDDTVWPRWLVQLLARMGLRTEFGPFCRVFEREHLHDAFRGRCDYWTALREYLVEAGLSRSQIAEVEVAGLPRWRQCEEDVRLLPGVHRGLTQLVDRGARLAILTNSCYPAESLDLRLTRLGVRSLFAAVVSSRDLGCALPDRDAYSAVLNRLQLPAREVAFVSDDPTELSGAAAAELFTVSLQTDPALNADLLVDRLADLADEIPWAGGRSQAA